MTSQFAKRRKYEGGEIELGIAFLFEPIIKVFFNKSLIYSINLIEINVIIRLHTYFTS